MLYRKEQGLLPNGLVYHASNNGFQNTELLGYDPRQFSKVKFDVLVLAWLV